MINLPNVDVVDPKADVVKFHFVMKDKLRRVFINGTRATMHCILSKRRAIDNLHSANIKIRPLRCKQINTDILRAQNGSGNTIL